MPFPANDERRVPNSTARRDFPGADDAAAEFLYRHRLGGSEMAENR
jgi:hypothetical protein